MYVADNHFDYSDHGFFGVKLGRFRLGPNWPGLTLAQVFQRAYMRVGGVSLLQIGKRHLLYVGHDTGISRLCLGFVWLTKEAS